jgi:cellulose synthase/poly-beta-1,6-N-acetylglucosamine synthase-like glycosyltransferase
MAEAQGPAPRLSVIMPSFNEEGSIEAAVRDVQEHVFALVPDSELLVVDSSRDRTPEILARLATADPRVRVIAQPPRGHGEAVRAGLDLARGEFVFLIDSDRQVPLERVPAGAGAAIRLPGSAAALEAGAAGRKVASGGRPGRGREGVTMTPWAWLGRRPRLLVFGLALLVRLLCGAVTFGSRGGVPGAAGRRCFLIGLATRLK